jgi:DNA-binding response OmpR family regulator
MWLRQKLEDDPGAPRCIVTMRGEGYRFERTL